MHSIELREAERRLLFDLARGALEHPPAPPPVEEERLPEPLTRPAATFVTLKKEEQLRGCIGTLEAHRPLARDVAHNAWAAAFRDPRFPPLEREEATAVRIVLSLLGPAQPLEVEDESELLRTLRPGVDGLILSCGAQRATFLPAVWQDLPDPADFVAALGRKAGLSPHHGFGDLAFWRYTVLELEEWA
jgi:AmmeMemoRadiSam system protein A